MSEIVDAGYLDGLDNTLADEYVGVYEALAYRTPPFLDSIPGLCWVDTHGNVIHTDHCTGHGETA